MCPIHTSSGKDAGGGKLSTESGEQLRSVIRPDKLELELSCATSTRFWFLTRRICIRDIEHEEEGANSVIILPLLYVLD